MKKITQEEILNYAKQYGFIFQGLRFMEVCLILGIMDLWEES